MEYKDNESIAYLTSTVAQALADSLARHFLREGIDLPFSQFVLLMQLYQQDGQTQQELAKVLHKDKAAIKRTVDNLVTRGLVIRAPQEGITRNVPLFLTSKAIVLRERVRDIYARHYGEIMQDITPEELSAANETLRKVLANLRK